MPTVHNEGQAPNAQRLALVICGCEELQRVVTWLWDRDFDLELGHRADLQDPVLQLHATGVQQDGRYLHVPWAADGEGGGVIRGGGCHPVGHGDVHLHPVLRAARGQVHQRTAGGRPGAVAQHCVHRLGVPLVCDQHLNGQSTRLEGRPEERAPGLVPCHLRPRMVGADDGALDQVRHRVQGHAPLGGSSQGDVWGGGGHDPDTAAAVRFEELWVPRMDDPLGRGCCRAR
mmetsp:Transcript_120446/g.209681  ORF Transcript_120446/g.209681 Transcript_120446/m.209681 type:complete len:230 (+) Transcript_120446:1162-1851(+)